MKLVPFDGERGEFLIGDLDSFGVNIFIERCLDLQSFSSPGIADQIDDNLTADEGTPSPVGGDVAEHAVFDFVPLAGSRREMTNLNRQIQFVGEPL